MPASFYQQTGISISVFEPTIDISTPDYTAQGLYKDDLTSQIESYKHTINAFGGYWEAQFTIKDTLKKLETWLTEGLGWHVETYNPSLSRIFEGFVNGVSLSVGGLSVTRGPLLDIANRASLIYSTVDTTTNPPTLGRRLTTAIVQDADSQNAYGIVDKILSGGGMITAEAEDVRDTYLEENKDPQTSKKLSTGATASEPTVTINCLGYVHWLTVYPYNQVVNSGTSQLSDKIDDILDADPNGIFSSANADIATNGLLVPRYENKNRLALALIKSLVAHGDVNANRYVFGVYNNQRAVYEQIPTTIEYQQRLADPKQRIETLAGTEVKPWNVLPARWLFFLDFLIGQATPVALRDDPRAMFIESVTYNAPWQLDLVGGKVTTLNQKLARMGLAGLGA